MAPLSTRQKLNVARSELRAALNREFALRLALRVVARPLVEKAEDAGANTGPALKAIDRALLSTGRGQKIRGGSGGR